jgi:hypothetical protein
MPENIVVYDRDTTETTESTLERKLIAEYLLDKGYCWSDLKNLPKKKANNLMKEACRYAALKLAEIEARSKFRRKIQPPH